MANWEQRTGPWVLRWAGWAGLSFFFLLAAAANWEVVVAAGSGGIGQMSHFCFLLPADRRRPLPFPLEKAAGCLNGRCAIPGCVWHQYAVHATHRLEPRWQLVHARHWQLAALWHRPRRASAVPPHAPPPPAPPTPSGVTGRRKSFRIPGAGRQIASGRTPGGWKWQFKFIAL